MGIFKKNRDETDDEKRRLDVLFSYYDDLIRGYYEFVNKKNDDKVNAEYYKYKMKILDVRINLQFERMNRMEMIDSWRVLNKI